MRSRRSSGGAAQVGLPAPADAAGQRALGERAPDQGAQAVTLGGGQDLGLDATIEQGIRRLLGVQALEAAALGQPLRLDDRGRRRVGGADRTDLAAAYEIGQGRQGLLQVGARIEAVDLVEVDVVGAQAAQGVLDRRHDPAAGGALPVRVVAHRPAELGGDHDAVAAALQGLADDLLGFAVRVDVRRVDEVDAGVQGLVHDADGLVVVGIADAGGLAEHHGAERVGADLDAGPA
ncbi:hypothetical protein SAMN05421748_10815 [Paractinoplanes atraurantiacus]|uniref:Uncharacterized protein n=1 Tax=Paractinoplanes atraurantiacus TaxID=1036182 RepID=A0A285IFU4_9ACTN|nr:hypothetical protein SAMN05421748_10815 [Actinoplanes atraurantiacus]